MKSTGVVRRSLCATILSLLASAQLCVAAKILLLPANLDSHVACFAKVAEALAKEGHTVHMLVSSNGQKVETSHSNFVVTTYSVEGVKPFIDSPTAAQWFIDIALSKSYKAEANVTTRRHPFFPGVDTALCFHHDSFALKYRFPRRKLRQGGRVEKKFTQYRKFPKQFTPGMAESCVSLIKDKQLMEDIGTSQYEFVIMDTFAANCFRIIPESLNIPYGILSTAWSETLYRLSQMPCLPNKTSPDQLDALKINSLVTSEDLWHCFIELSNRFTSNFSSIHSTEQVARDLPSLNQVFRRSSVWLFMEDPSLENPVPTLSNTLSVGDLLAGQAVNYLPYDLNYFVNQSPDGVILVSFGSFSDYIPREVEDKFCNVFRTMKFRVIWKQPDRYCQDVANVRTVSRFPQNDLLASEKVRLFINDGAISSLAEALFHAKPLIVFPIAPEQARSVAAARSMGYATLMDLSNFTEAELTENIQKVLYDSRYLSAARFNSAIKKEKTISSGKAISHLIQHVIKFGDSHVKAVECDFEVSTQPYLEFTEKEFLVLVILVLLLIVCSMILQILLVLLLPRKLELSISW